MPPPHTHPSVWLKPVLKPKNLLQSPSGWLKLFTLPPFCRGQTSLANPYSCVAPPPPPNTHTSSECLKLQAPVLKLPQNMLCPPPPPSFRMTKTFPAPPLVLWVNLHLSPPPTIFPSPHPIINDHSLERVGTRRARAASVCIT